MSNSTSSNLDWSRLVRHPWVVDGEHHLQIDSTNRRAHRLLEESGQVDTPYLICAESQTQGRGRGENRWYSSDGALTFSLIWRPPASVDVCQVPISLLVGAAICQVLDRLVPCHGERRTSVGLKWPNDVYLYNRKVAGILIESSGHEIVHYIIGIGINVHNRFDGAPDDVQRRAVALQSVAAQAVDRTDLLLRILFQLQGVLELHLERHERPWSRYCLLRGRTVRVRTAQREIEGFCQGTQDDGALLLVGDDPTIQVVYSGEVIGIKPELVAPSE